MEDLKKWEDLTPEERTELKRVLARSRWRMLFSATKFIGGLFLANILTQTAGHLIMGDVDPKMWFGFCLLSSIVNAIFLSRYFSSQMKINGDMLKAELQALLKQ